MTAGFMRQGAVAGASALALAAATGATAHHSYSMFDSGRTDTITGVVKSLDIVNPHSWLSVMVANPAGGETEYSMEMGGPGQIQREGWTPQVVQPGDKIIVRLHPLRDGSHGGQLVSAVLASGKTLQGGGPPGGGRGGPGGGF
jgi:Family of unknown function (DUF6152)